MFLRMCASSSPQIRKCCVDRAHLLCEFAEPHFCAATRVGFQIKRFRQRTSTFNAPTSSGLIRRPVPIKHRFLLLEEKGQTRHECLRGPRRRECALHRHDHDSDWNRERDVGALQARCEGIRATASGLRDDECCLAETDGRSHDRGNHQDQRDRCVRVGNTHSDTAPRRRSAALRPLVSEQQPTTISRARPDSWFLI